MNVPLATTPSVRLARSAALATACVALGDIGHRQVAGGPVRPELLLGVWALLVAAVWLVAGRRLPGTPILAVLIGGQALVHGAAVLTTSHTAAHHGGRLAYACAVQGSHGTGIRTPVAMGVVHALATLAAAWWLRRGEGWVWTLTRRLARAVVGVARRLMPSLPATAARPAARVAIAGDALCPARLARSRPHRGPPLAHRA